MVDSAHLFVLAILVFVFGLVSRVMSRGVVTGPLAFVVFGTGLRPGTIAFMGWFGLRGLASVLFAVLVIKELPVPHSELIVQIVLVTVLLSVLAHGMTAAPLSAVYARGAWPRRDHA